MTGKENASETTPKMTTTNTATISSSLPKVMLSTPSRSTGSKTSPLTPFTLTSLECVNGMRSSHPSTKPPSSLANMVMTLGTPATTMKDSVLPMKAECSSAHGKAIASEIIPKLLSAQLHGKKSNATNEYDRTRSSDPTNGTQV